MRTKQLIAAVTCIVVLVIAAAACLFPVGEKPYKNLDAAQIASAQVLLSPPDKTVEIQNIQALVDYLKEVVIYNEDSSYTEYVGQSVLFTLAMADGTQVEIIAYNPFLINDGVGYKTKYEPCEALNQYANELFHSSSANIIMEESAPDVERIRGTGNEALLFLSQR